jgi:hypothetical protein
MNSVGFDARSSFTFWKAYEGEEPASGREELLTITLCASGDCYYDWYAPLNDQELEDICSAMLMVPGGCQDPSYILSEMNGWAAEPIAIHVGRVKDVYGNQIQVKHLSAWAKQYIISKVGWTRHLDSLSEEEVVQQAEMLYKKG